MYPDIFTSDERVEVIYSTEEHKLFNIRDYVTLQKLGSGSYGQVYLVKNLKTQFLYAFKKSYINDGILKHTLREISLLRILQHPNIITMHQVLLSETKCYMVIEYMKTNLCQFIKDNEMSPNLVKSFMFQLLQAILFCHNRGIVHRDIKSHNILVHHDLKTVKLIDFGMARKIDNTRLPMTPVVVTLYYRSPEVLIDEMYNSSLDIWSLGCVFVEMIMKRVPFRGIGEISSFDILYSCFSQLGLPSKEDLPGFYEKVDGFKFPEDEVEENIFPILKNNVTENCYDLIMKMFIYNPDKRICATQALRHEYFHDLDKSVVPAFNEENCGFPSSTEG